MPRDTVMGLVLSSLYVNELPRLLSSYVLLHADDVKIWRAIGGKGSSLELQNDLEKLCEWFKTLQLPKNTSKCIMMHIGHQGTDRYMMNKIKPTVVQTHRLKSRC